MLFPLRLLVTAVLAAGLALPAAADDASVNPLSAPKGKYILDPNHTLVTFCIKHMGVSTYCGRFNKVSGEATFNGAQPDKSSAKVSIDVASVDTPSDALDAKLREEFFETAKFPTATFETTAISVTGKTTGQITGNLTLHGVTKPVTLKTTFNGGRTHPMRAKYLLGFSAETTLKHADFAFPDVAWNVFIGDEVTLMISVEMQADQ
jgi:polyisoprenoid-binding protein YceI